jgi:uncharacterized membrane protein YedE/YeeE
VDSSPATSSSWTLTPRLSDAALATFRDLGIHDLHGLVPRELFSWQALTTVPGIVLIVIGGFLVGFGTAYAGGCTSGHAISGLADLQLPSLIAVIGFFAGGLISTWLICRGSWEADTMRGHVLFLLVGALFGIVLTKAEVISWFRIQEMFRFQAFHMYGIIGSAVLTAGISLQIIRSLKLRSIDGQPISIPPR